jgi:hypothetical protein
MAFQIGSSSSAQIAIQSQVICRGVSVHGSDNCT